MSKNDKGVVPDTQLFNFIEDLAYLVIHSGNGSCIGSPGLIKMGSPANTVDTRSRFIEPSPWRHKRGFARPGRSQGYQSPPQAIQSIPDRQHPLYGRDTADNRGLCRA